jgi:nitrite reductase (NO-forming)
MRNSINSILISGLVIVVLVAGLVFSPIFTGQSSFTAEAAPPLALTSTCLITKHVLLTAGETRVQITPDGKMYNAMTWNNKIPGPVISVDQGDCLKITVTNNGALIHSLDFHAGNGPSNAIGCGNIPPHTTIDCPTVLHADTPGFFMYHCAGDNIKGIWEHIANGMYGGIVVHPHIETPAKEFYVVFGEIYSTSTTAGTTGSFDINKLLADNPDFVLTNGMKFKYVKSIGLSPPLVLNPAAEVFKVKPGELTRWYIVNAGPNDDVAFHFISGLISVHDGLQGTGGVASGQLGTQLTNDETWNIPAGSASVIESTFPEAGTYVGVDHSMKDVVKGGAFKVEAIKTSTPTDHPTGTWVPPKGSPIAVGHPF